MAEAYTDVAAKDWTNAQVLQWLASIGFSDCAPAFSRTDGPSLVLLDSAATLVTMGVDRAAAGPLFGRIRALEPPSTSTEEPFPKRLKMEETTKMSQYWVTFRSMQQEGSYLTHASGFLSQQAPKEMFVRESYPKVYDFITESEQRNFILTGNPGVGKSLFLSYFLFREMTSGKIICYESVYNRAVYCFFPNGEVGIIRDDTAPLPSDVAYYLFDAGIPRRVPRGVSLTTKTIVASSPDQDNFRNVVDFRAEILYLPCWSLQELLECATLTHPEQLDYVQRAYNIFGGIARYCLNPSDEKSSLKRLQSKLDNLAEEGAENLVRCFANKSLVSANVSHMLVQFEVDVATFQSSGIRFASEHIENEVNEKISRVNRVRRWKWVTSDLFGVPEAGAFRGLLFQRLMFDAFSVNGTWRATMLHKANENVMKSSTSKADTFSLDLVSSGVCIYDANSPPTFQQKMLYVPKQKNAKTFDAFIIMARNRVFSFQMTVSKNHSVMLEVLEEMWPNLYIHHFFVVPADMYSEFFLTNAQMSPNNKSVNMYKLEGKEQ